MKRAGVTTARPVVVRETTFFATGVLTASVLDSTSFCLPLSAFVEAFIGLEAICEAFLAAASTLRASISAFFAIAFACRSTAFLSRSTALQALSFWASSCRIALCKAFSYCIATFFSFSKALLALLIAASSFAFVSLASFSSMIAFAACTFARLQKTGPSSASLSKLSLLPF
jgi:hypothetical protein